MGSFLTGLLQGNVDQASKMKKAGNKGVLRGKKKKPGQQGSGETDYEGIMNFKRGGKVKRTGRARVHKGEQVLTAKQGKRYRSKKR
jgi:hypothetical protein